MFKVCETNNNRVDGSMFYGEKSLKDIDKLHSHKFCSEGSRQKLSGDEVVIINVSQRALVLSHTFSRRPRRSSAQRVR